MQISIFGILGCQFEDLDFYNNWNIGDIDKRKFKKYRWVFSYLQKKYFSIQFHVNLEWYILGNQIRVNFIDFNFIDLNLNEMSEVKKSKRTNRCKIKCLEFILTLAHLYKTSIYIKYVSHPCNLLTSLVIVLPKAFMSC